MAKLSYTYNKTIFLKVILPLILVVAGFVGVAPTFAYYQDPETATNNSISSSSVDISLNNITNFSAGDLGRGESDTLSLDVTNDGSLDTIYDIRAMSFAGDTDLCDVLDLEVTVNGTSEYTGNLVDLVNDPALDLALTAGNSDNVNFEVTLPLDADSSLSNLTCDFDIEFRAKQPSFDYGEAFNDTESYSTSISSDELHAVVINELMWMGSQKAGVDKPEDEWIELRNTTSSDIDLEDWKIAGLTLPSGATISANGFYLITNYDPSNVDSALDDAITPDYIASGLALPDGGAALELVNPDGAVVDETASDSWAAGIDVGGTRNSMERNDTWGDGTSSGSWHTCIDDGCNADAFWDDPLDKNYGTPRSANLSLNDSSTLKAFLASQKDGDLTVEVLDVNGKPIENADVTVHSTPRKAKTDKEGKAKFKDIEYGNHTLFVNYEDVEFKKVFVMDNLTEPVFEIQLKEVEIKDTTDVKVTVVDGDDKELKDVKVILELESETEVNESSTSDSKDKDKDSEVKDLEESTNDKGEAKFDEVSFGDYKLKVEYKDNDKSEDITVDKDHNEFTVKLKSDKADDNKDKDKDEDKDKDKKDGDSKDTDKEKDDDKDSNEDETTVKEEPTTDIDTDDEGNDSTEDSANINGDTDGSTEDTQPVEEDKSTDEDTDSNSENSDNSDENDSDSPDNADTDKVIEEDAKNTEEPKDEKEASDKDKESKTSEESEGQSESKKSEESADESKSENTVDQPEESKEEK